MRRKEFIAKSIMNGSIIIAIFLIIYYLQCWNVFAQFDFSNSYQYRQEDQGLNYYSNNFFELSNPLSFNQSYPTYSNAWTTPFAMTSSDYSQLIPQFYDFTRSGQQNIFSSQSFEWGPTPINTSPYGFFSSSPYISPYSMPWTNNMPWTTNIPLTIYPQKMTQETKPAPQIMPIEVTVDSSRLRATIEDNNNIEGKIVILTTGGEYGVYEGTSAILSIALQDLNKDVLDFFSININLYTGETEHLFFLERLSIYQVMQILQTIILSTLFNGMKARQKG